MSSKPSIGFAGLGAMGLGMATNLVKQGYTVTGFDLYPPSLEKFQNAGGIPSASLSESAKDKPFYIVMVATAQQAQSALFEAEDGGIVKHLPQGATLILCSTVPSSYVLAVEKELKEKGREDIYFIDAPVSGGTFRAADGTLSIMAGASDAAFEKGMFLLEEMSAPTKLFIVKGGIGAGSNMKMVHQVLAAIHILALSEAFGLAARLGLNGKEVREEIVKEGSKAWSWMFENRSVRTLAEDYFPGASAVTIILKDTGIITSTARRVQYPATLCTVAEQVYIAGVERGWGPNDDSGLVRLWTSDPVASIQSTSDANKEQNMSVVRNLLIGIHLVAVAESIAFAKHLGLPLQQLFTLASEAAGGSAMFWQFGQKMIDVLEGKGDANEDLGEYTTALVDAVTAAWNVKCPTYLGSGAMNLLLQAGQGKPTVGSLVGLYRVQPR